MRSSNLEGGCVSASPQAPANMRSDTLMRHFQAHAPHYGLNAATLLSPEPLSQYSRLAMLFSLLPSAPRSIAPQIFSWRAVSYPSHFAASQHPSKDFIAAAWRYAPCKPQFDAALIALCETSVNAIAALRLLIAHGKVHQARALCEASAENIASKTAAARNIAIAVDAGDCQGS